MTARGYAIGYLDEIDMGPEIIEYMSRVEGTFEPFGGEWLVHGVQPEVVEGDLTGSVVIIGFPSLDDARSWYESPAYREILTLRTDHSRSIVALLPGVPDGYRAAQTIANLLAD